MQLVRPGIFLIHQAACSGSAEASSWVDHDEHIEPADPRCIHIAEPMLLSCRAAS